MKRRLAAIAMATMLMACMKSKAALDGTFHEAILWPGGNEKPRITYLFSLSRIAGGGEDGSSVVFGDPEYEAGELTESPVLQRPLGVFVDWADVLYITDPGARRLCVIDMKTMDSFNITMAGDLPLAYPLGVAADALGRIYMTDSELKAVFVFDREGKFLYFFDGDMRHPTGIAIDEARGVVYVSDTWANAIYKYTKDGKRVGTIGGESADDNRLLNHPTYLALDDEGTLYVSDTLNFRVRMFSAEGALIGGFGIPGTWQEAFDKIKGIAVDTEGHIYVADSALDMVKIYSRDGTLLLTWGGEGSYYGQFLAPAGMYMDRKNRIFVADMLNQRVQAFRFLGGD